MSVVRTDSVRLTIAIAAHEGWHCNRGTWGMIGAPHGRRVNHFWTATCERSSTWSSSRFWHHHQGAQCAHAVTLRKTLYILHQTPRAWKEKRVDDILMSFGFRRSLSKHAIYIRWNDDLQMAISTNQYKRTLKHLFERVLIFLFSERWCDTQKSKSYNLEHIIFRRAPTIKITWKKSIASWSNYKTVRYTWQWIKLQ